MGTSLFCVRTLHTKLTNRGRGLRTRPGSRTTPEPTAGGANLGEWIFTVPAIVPTPSISPWILRTQCCRSTWARCLGQGDSNFRVGWFASKSVLTRHVASLGRGLVAMLSLTPCQNAWNLAACRQLYIACYLCRAPKSEVVEFQGIACKEGTLRHSGIPWQTRAKWVLNRNRRFSQSAVRRTSARQPHIVGLPLSLLMKAQQLILPLQGKQTSAHNSIHKFLHFGTYQEKQLLTNSDQLP